MNVTATIDLTITIEPSQQPAKREQRQLTGPSRRTPAEATYQPEKLHLAHTRKLLRSYGAMVR